VQKGAEKCRKETGNLKPETGNHFETLKS